MKYFSRQYLFLLIGIVFFAGCERTLAERRYTEIVMEPDAAPNTAIKDPQDFLSRMPQDDIHAAFAGANGSNVPANMQTNDPVLQEQLNASVARLPLVWKTPSSWSETKGSGMRLATFNSKDKSTETTIISLGGSAGGIAANVSRWMQQINLEVPAQGLESFIQEQERSKTASGLAYTLIDFTHLQEKATSDAPSMIAVVMEADGAQIFVKMTGSKQAVLQNRKDFMNLVSSLKVN